MKLRTHSMRFQTSAIISVAFVLSHLAGYAFYSLDRHDALVTTEALDFADRAAGLSRLLRDLPQDRRDDVIRFSHNQAFRVWTSDAPAIDMIEASEEEFDLLAYLRTQVPRISRSEMYARFVNVMEDRHHQADAVNAPAGIVKVSPSPSGSAKSFAISVNHPGGEWINFLGPITPSNVPATELLAANIFSTVLGIAVVAFWLVDRVTRPLATLASAAENLGRNIHAAPLDVSGPMEVAVAARAFNRMQSRILKLIESRTTLLAAISHDLRTPLAQLRLRTEQIGTTERGERMLKSIAEMEAMLDGFLAFASAAHENESPTAINLCALVESICDDLKDLGMPVDCHCSETIVIHGKGSAITRAVSNVIDNGLKYAGSVTVSIVADHGVANIVIEDDGPGIPEEQMSRVLSAWYRGDQSKKSYDKGMGLGLSITQAIVEDHGGEVCLQNISPVGLRAELMFPILARNA